MRKIKYALLALLTLAAFASCKQDSFEEITALELSRCLQPMGLNARVNSTLGDVVTFSWDVTKDADSYQLVVYTDAAMTSEYLSETLAPASVPYQKKLDADKTYYFTVQAFSDKKEPSKVAVYEKSFKTFAVKDNLYLKVASRTAASVSLAWSKEVEDFAEVDRIEYALPGGDALGAHTLTAEEIAAAAATVDGLSASTEYVFTLYFLSAARGQVDAWTTADVSGTTPVATLDALLNAVKTPGAKILLKMEGSPYDIGSLDIANGFSLYGEEAADGTKPVVQGEFHFADTWAAGSGLYFEGVTFDGGPTAASPSGFGFAIQNKNGGTLEDKNIGDITYKNCVITNFTKGLIYEWGKKMVLGKVTYDGCEISNINPDGTVGGDVFDIRQATTVESLSFVGNTIFQGMRTFVRFDAGTLGALVFENNTLQNLNFVDNTNNAGVFGLQITPGSFSFKNNLFLNMTGKAVLAGANVKYVPASDMGVAAANNWFYNLPVADDGTLTYFTSNFTQSNAAGTILGADPCYNAPGGFFNILPDSEIADKKVGAPKWWTPFVEEPEDLTLGTLAGNKTWNLGNAKYFSGTVKKEMVRDELYINASEANAIVCKDGMLNFQSAAVTNRQGVPSVGYVAFKVAGPGSLLVKAADPESKGNHFVIGVGPVDGSEIALKGGVSALSDMANAQKILITSIAEESMVYLFPSGPVSLEKLAWSTDVTPVNTALPTPAPKADPTSITAGDAADITVSWEPVEGAGSYSVVFKGKSNTVSEGTEYVIGGTTTGMLDAGSYTVEVYANPAAGDIYNTESAAGVAAFAVLPKGGSDEGAELVVTSVDQLLSAIAAGKDAITLAAGEYDLGGVLTLSAPLALKGQPGAVVTGAFKLSGAEVGDFSLENLTVKAGGQGVLIDMDGDNGVTAGNVTVRNVVIDGFAKSVIYAANKADAFTLGDILFQGVEVYNHGTGQGMFDLRNGKYASFSIVESTLTQGRDFLRIDATCAVPTVLVQNNTMYNLNTSKNGNGIFYVRADVPDYKVEKNLLLGMTSGTVIGKTGAKVPKMVRNYFYNCNDDVFFTGILTKEEALGGQGVVLSVDPVRNAAENDFTLVNGVVISAGVGAPKWNPSVVPPSEGAAMTVATVDEFLAAVDAGKTDIKFAAGEYDLTAANVTLTAGMHLSGEPGATLKVTQIELAAGELGNLLVEGLTIVGDDTNNLINVGAASVVGNLTVRNCDISHVKKSVLYGNAEGSSFEAVVLSNLMLTDLGGGQGTIDIRKGTYGVVTVENCTVAGGRDFIRADASRVTRAVNIVNNTFDGVTLENGNGILYVRSTPESYVLKNNLFLNENGSNNLLSKASGITVPTAVANNYFFGCTAEKFWTGLINQEVALAGGGVILANDPVKDAAAHDYTLVDALCLASNVGAARWNPNAGRVSSELTVSSVAEMANAIDAGKTALTLTAGTYDLRELAESGVVTLIAPLSLSGKGTVEIIGGFKFGAGTTSFTAENIRFNGAEKVMGNAFEIAEAVEMSQIKLVGCDIFAYNKSLFYGNGDGSKIGLFDFEKNLVHGFGTGQGMIDIRKGAYTAINVSKNTFYDGGRDFIRCDKEIAGSIAITNNTFAACSIDAGNGLLWVRSCAGDAASKYVVKKNLFLNLTGDKTILAKSGATVPTMASNYFFNVGPAFWGGAISQEVATTGGAVLEADPCAASAEGNFRLVNADLKTADVGDPRWNSSSPSYTKQK